MAQVGQTTQTGGREANMHPDLAQARRVTVPVPFTVNYIGLYARDQNVANQNALKGAIYAVTATALQQVTNVHAATMGTTHALRQLPFSDTATVYPAGDYVLAVAGSPGTNGVGVVNGANGTAGDIVSMSTTNIYTTFPSSYSGLVDTATPRQWDIFLDYTEAATGVNGSLAATESGADTCAAAGTVGNNGLRLTLRDTDTGALAVNKTGVIVSVRSSSNAGSLLYSTSSGTTNGSGVYQLASGAIGSIGTYVYVTVELSDNSVAAVYRVQVIDLNA